MTTNCSAGDAPVKRYFQDNNQTHPDAAGLGFEAALHPAYVRWVAQNGHRRDFRTCVEHEANLWVFEYLVARQAPADFALRLPNVLPTVALRTTKTASDMPERFYDETCAINPKLNNAEVAEVLPVMLRKWLEQGWLCRDFPHAVTSAADALVYDHELALSFQGLGGGPTAEDFLTTARPLPAIFNQES